MNHTQTAHAQPEALILTTGDGYSLAALRYQARAPLRGYLLVAGATGVAQLFYKAFAEFAANQGYTTLTLDYRGIGLSRPGKLRGFRVALLDWAQQDLAAAVDLMASDRLPLFMVGHSLGGHAFGLLPNHHRVARFYTFATGAGWSGWMPPLERWKVNLMWHFMGPLLTHWKGYLAWSMLGMGEDLPLGVYRDWKHWCRYPRYFFDDPNMTHLVERFARVTTPIMAANALDDLWAPPASRDAFMAGYSGTTVKTMDIEPGQYGLERIGHMGYFRRNAQPLWQEALRWFDTHSQAA
jgi:predicted alpha/beta hydrolase